MSIATTLREYLENEGIEYDILAHPSTQSASETAHAAHIPGDLLVKSVVLEDEQGYVMAVIPSTRRVEIGKLSKQLNRRLGLATENELSRLFDDCETGAIPPIGQAYGMDVVIDDDCLAQRSDVYFEGGDHMDLVHVSGRDFQTLMREVRHCHFTRHV